MGRWIVLMAGLLVACGAFAQSGTRPRSAVSLLPEVTMYATDWCPYCEQARRYLHRNDIRYTERDVEKSPGALAEFRRLGGRGTPLIVVGERMMMGYREETPADMLKAAGY